MSLAAVLFNCQKEQETFKILSFISEKFLEHYPKEDFAQIIWNYVGLDIPFLTYMIEHKGFEEFLGSYQQEIVTLLEELSIKEQNTYFVAAINDLKEKVQLHSKEDYEQQELPTPTLILNDTIRMAEISLPLSSDIEHALDEHLLFSVYTHAKMKCYDNEVIDYLIDETKNIRKQWIEENSLPTTLFSPFLYYVNSDILSVIGHSECLNMSINYQNLWNHSAQYSIDTVLNTQFDNHFKLSDSLKEHFNIEQGKLAIWILNKDDELIISPQYIDGVDKEIHHTDLAKGQNVKAAGAMLFSNDFKEIIAINNGTGHYKTTIESCLLINEAILKSHYDTQHTVICDVDWNVQFTLQKNQQHFLDKIKKLKMSWSQSSIEDNKKPSLK